MMINVIYTYCVGHFAIYTNIESMLYTWNKCNATCQLYPNKPQTMEFGHQLVRAEPYTYDLCTFPYMC